MAGCLIANELTCQQQGRSLFLPVSFQLNAGEGLCVQGKNGIGKSSLLKIISGLKSPMTGQLLWHGKPITNAYRHALAYLSEASGLKTGLTIEENWETTLAIQQTKALVDFNALLSQFQLPKKTRVCDLSAGQQQKAALAKLCLVKKNLWVLDEPETALDAEAKVLLTTLMQAHLNEGGTLLFSTHESKPLFHHTIKVLHLCATP